MSHERRGGPGHRGRWVRRNPDPVLPTDTHVVKMPFGNYYYDEKLHKIHAEWDQEWLKVISVPELQQMLEQLNELLAHAKLQELARVKAKQRVQGQGKVSRIWRPRVKESSQ